MSTASTILAIELSTSQGEVAVLRDGEILFESKFASQRSHNSQLFDPLRMALAKAGDGLSSIVVGLGPGSYTGVRIAISAAQGISMTLSVPVIGLPSILAPDQTPMEDSFCVIGDARRDGYFAATIRQHGIDKEGIQVMGLSELGAWLSERDSMPIYTFDAKMQDIASATLTRPSAARLAALAQLSGTIPGGTPLEPIYLRDAFITESKLPWSRI